LRLDTLLVEEQFHALLQCVGSMSMLPPSTFIVEFQEKALVAAAKKATAQREKLENATQTMPATVASAKSGIDADEEELKKATWVYESSDADIAAADEAVEKTTEKSEAADAAFKEALESAKKDEEAAVTNAKDAFKLVRDAEKSAKEAVGEREEALAKEKEEKEEGGEEKDGDADKKDGDEDAELKALKDSLVEARGNTSAARKVRMKAEDDAKESRVKAEDAAAKPKAEAEAELEAAKNKVCRIQAKEVV
jgi:hypothetical protein